MPGFIKIEISDEEQSVMRMSGIPVKLQIAERLEREGFKFKENWMQKVLNPNTDDIGLAGKFSITCNMYERTTTIKQYIDDKLADINKLTIYAHKEKGGSYEVLSASSRGAGTMRGVDLVIYRDTVTGKVYHRKPSDFEQKMMING